VSIDGDVIVVGSPLDDDAGESTGSAHVFRYDGTHWVEEQKLIASDGAAGDLFGFSVAVSGPVVGIGAPYDLGGGGAGLAYVFRHGATGWTEEQ
jgi:hypothetical protein